jgi:hypothetical protein
MSRNKYEIVSQVVNEQQYTKIKMNVGGGKVRSVILDGVTATQIKNLFDKAPDDKRAQLMLLPWDRLLGLVWRLTA